jgi:molecular chaperone HscB
MKLDCDDFELFELPRTFKQDRSVIDAQWRALQAQVHPDRFVTHDAATQRFAMQCAVRVNEAYQRLKNPLQRAAYLCELAGVPIQAHSNTAMPSEFLIQQMRWRETLADTQGLAQVLALQQEVLIFRGKILDDIGLLLDMRGDFHRSAQQVRALMFVERFTQDLDHRIDLLEQS